MIGQNRLLNIENCWYKAIFINKITFIKKFITIKLKISIYKENKIVFNKVERFISNKKCNIVR